MCWKHCLVHFLAISCCSGRRQILKTSWTIFSSACLLRVRHLKGCVLTQSPFFQFFMWSLNSTMMKRTSEQITGSHGVLAFISFQWMTIGNILSLSTDIISCTQQFFLSVLACGCMWVCVCGMLMPTAHGILLRLTSVETLSPAGSVGSFIMLPLLIFTALRKISSSTNGSLWAHFVSISCSVSPHIRSSLIEYKICF